MGSRVCVVGNEIRCCWDGRSVGSRVCVLLGMRLGAVGMEGVWGVGFLGLLGLRLGVVGMEGVWAVGFLCVVGNEIRCC